MLSLYSSFKVPGVDSVTLYRDDDDPHAFYMVPTRPSGARDTDGDPMFVFNIYARDLDRLGPTDAEVARGYLSLTTRVGVTREEEETIRQYLRGRLNNEMLRGYRFLMRTIDRIEPTLGYPHVWTDGTVSFFTFDDSMVSKSAGSVQPLLVGENTATFSQFVNQDGAELFRQSLERGVVPSIVLYTLHFLARIPAVKIHIHGNRRDFYQELKQKCVAHEIRLFNGAVIVKWFSPEMASLREFRSTFHSLTIDIDSGDFRDADPSEDVTQKLEELAFKILETNILPSFFEQGFAPPTGDQTKDKWLRDETHVTEGTVDVTFNRRDVVKQPVNPNAQLGRMLTPAEVKNHITYIDLGDAMFKELDVRINANVNFATDPVFALKVFIDYHQHDEIRNVTVHKPKEFIFRTGSEVGRFRTILAKAADGTLKDTYRYHSELQYKDTGATVRIPASGEIEGRERELVISYRRLGFVKVLVTLSSMPDTIRGADVDIWYPGSTLPTARQQLVLTSQKPIGTFFTYTGSNNQPGPYRYTVKFRLSDGRTMDVPETEGTAESLTITNPFEDTVTTRFIAQADFALVQTVVVDAKYEDAANDFRNEFHAELTLGAMSAAWSLPLRNPDLRAYTFDEMTLFKNGSLDKKTGRAGVLGGTVTVGQNNVDNLEVSIDAGLLDWSKYARAIVSLRYVDAINAVDEQKQFRFDQASSTQIPIWRVPLRDRAKRRFKVRISLIGKVQTDDRNIDEYETDMPFVLVR